jgi:PAS domain S-box-containing protein
MVHCISGHYEQQVSISCSVDYILFMVHACSSPDAFNLDAALASLGQNQLQLLQSLWEGVDYGIFILDVLDDGKNFRYAAFNPMMARISPIPVAILLDRTIRDILPASMSQRYHDRYGSVVETGEPLRFEESFCHEGVTSLWMMQIHPLRDQYGQVNQLLVTASDLNPQSDLIGELQASQTKLQASERKFRHLVEEANDVIGTWELDSVSSYLSPSFRTHFGYDPADWVGQSFLPLVHPDDLAIYLATNRQVIETAEQRIGLEFRHRHQEGHWIWVSMNLAPVQSPQGKITGLQGILRDIGDRKAAEQAMRDYALQQAMLNQLSNQIRYSLDLNAVITIAIESIRSMLNIDACGFAWYQPKTTPPTWHLIQEAKVAGQPSSLGIYPVSVVGNLEQLLMGQDIFYVDDATTCTDPTHREFLATIGCQSEMMLSIQTQSEHIGVIICTHHSSQRRWRPDELDLLKAISNPLAIAIDQAALYADSQMKGIELQQTLRELQHTQSQIVQSEKMSSLGQLVAGIAHEINNPVNFIHGNVAHAQGYAQDLLELIELYRHTYPDPGQSIRDKINHIDLPFVQEDLLKSLRSMQVGTIRIREIVSSLRIFSRLDEADIKPVDIHEGIDSTLMILQSRIKAAAKGAGINIVKDYGPLPAIECFAGQLNQVFMNILANAIDALEECDRHRSATQIAEVPSQICISTELDGDTHVLIRIADSGGGIPKDIQARIFDPFFTTKAVGKGTGMGMSISYQIVTDRHRGQLLCHSILGQGTEFVVRIPVTQQRQDDTLTQALNQA